MIYPNNQIQLTQPSISGEFIAWGAAALATPAFPCVRRRGRSGAADGSLGTETQEMVKWETRLEYKINRNNDDDDNNNNSNDVLIMYSMLMYILVF